MNPIYKIILPLFFICFGTVLFSQNPQLAIHYYNRGEYEKASSIFEELVDKQPKHPFYFEKLMDCLTQLRKYDLAIERVDARIRAMPGDPMNHFLKGNIYELQNKKQEAEKSFRTAIQKASDNVAMISKLAQDFQERGKFELALATYEEILNKENVNSSFLFPMASLHYRLGQYGPMIDRYLDALEMRPESANFVLNYFQRYLPDDHLDTLETKVLERLQSSSVEAFNEVLAWTYIQRNDFAMAYRQLRSIDKRKNENGFRLFKLGNDALAADEYKDAERIFQYIIADKGPQSPYYFDSHKSLVKAKLAQIQNGNDPAKSNQERKVTSDYLHLLDSLGYTRFSAPLAKDIAEIQAFRLHDYPASIQTLEKVININGISNNLLSQSKILLGDIYLSTGERWEATLLYSQVDKTHKEDLVGQWARFKNAKLSYYMGEFDWAQKQFDILKSATSRLIANDAIDMSVFIIDNMGLDTTDQNLKAYARADFLHFQNRDQKSLETLDSLRNKLDAQHNLRDDILFLEARIYENNRDYEKALEKYDLLTQNFPDGIWADNALYAMADIYDQKLDAPLKAKDLYERIFLEYTNSTLAVYSRKKFREIKALYENDNIPDGDSIDSTGTTNEDLLIQEKPGEN